MQHDPFGPVRRQYVFRTRRCRQRIAQRLGAGQGAVRVAAVERLPLVEVEALARDAAFAGLVEHYRALEALDPAERRARLVAVASAMLERLVDTGDLRAVAFVLHEEGQGRDPAAGLADAVWRGIERGRERVLPEGCPHPSPRVEPGAGSLPDDREREPEGALLTPAGLLPPLPLAGEGRGEGGVNSQAGGRRVPVARPVNPWAFCAAVQPDAGAAGDLAMREAAAIPQRLARMAADLRRLVVAEVEREGTAELVMADIERAALAGRIGRALHDEPERAFRAARDLDRRRAGDLLPPLPLAGEGRGEGMTGTATGGPPARASPDG